MSRLEAENPDTRTVTYAYLIHEFQDLFYAQHYFAGVEICKTSLVGFATRRSIQASRFFNIEHEMEVRHKAR